MLTATVGYDGSAQALITATEVAGGVKIAIKLTGAGPQLVGDLRGLYLDLGSYNLTSSGFDDNSALGDESFNWTNNYLITGDDVTAIEWGKDSVTNLGPQANINGGDPSNAPVESYPGPNIFDLGIRIGTPGKEPDYVPETEFIIEGITLENLENNFFGLRVTSTEGSATSLKLVGKFTDGNTDDDWEGLSPGYWKNWSPEPPGNQVNDWSQDEIIANYTDDGDFTGYKTFEQVFGVGTDVLQDWLISPGIIGDDVTLLQSLKLGGDLKGGLKKNSLARQATAALLNSLEKDESDPNGAVNYRFTKEQVLEWTSDALGTGWESVAGAVSSYTDTTSWGTQQETVLGLADLFGSNNNLGLYA